MPDDETIIAALLREREGLVAKGDEVNVKGVDAELKRLGHKGAAPAKRATRRPAPKATTRKKAK